MPTFTELQQQISEVLLALPTISQKETRHALVEAAQLDHALRQQLDCDDVPANFVPRLVGVCRRYETLADDRDPLAAVLDAAKRYVNTTQRAACDRLIALLRTTPRPAPEESDSKAPAAEQHRAPDTTITQTAGDRAIQIGQARDVTITR